MVGINIPKSVWWRLRSILASTKLRLGQAVHGVTFLGQRKCSILLQQLGQTAETAQPLDFHGAPSNIRSVSPPPSCGLGDVRIRWRWRSPARRDVFTSRCLALLRSSPSNTQITPTPASFNSRMSLYQPKIWRFSQGIGAKCRRCVMSVPSLRRERFREAAVDVFRNRYIAMVFPDNDLSRCGSSLITSGLLGFNGGHGSRRGYIPMFLDKGCQSQNPHAYKQVENRGDHVIDMT